MTERVSKKPKFMPGNRAARILLDDVDRARALVIESPPTRLAKRPFDRSGCVDRLRASGLSGLRTSALGLSRDVLRLDTSMSEEEACFFWELFTGEGSGSLEKMLARATVGNVVPRGALPTWELVAAYPALAYVALGPSLFVELLRTFDNGASMVLLRFEDEVLPNLDNDARASLLVAVGVIDTPWMAWLASRVGASPKLILPLIESWSDAEAETIGCNIGEEGCNEYLRALFGLRDAEKILHHASRLRAFPASVTEVRMLLAVGGFLAVPFLTDAISAQDTKHFAEAFAAALALAEGPETARAMLELSRASKAKRFAREWLHANPDHTVTGLMPLVGAGGHTASAALDYLATLASRDLGALIEAELQTQPASIVRAVRARFARPAVATPAVATEAQLPEWARVCFGDSAKIVAPRLALAPEQERHVDRVVPRASPRPRAKVSMPAYEPMGVAAQFDIDRCIERLRFHCNRLGYYHPWALTKVTHALPMSRDEASFWLRATARLASTHDRGQLEAVVEQLRTPDDVPAEGNIRHPALVVPAFVLEGFEGIRKVASGGHDVARVVAQVLGSVVRVLSYDERQCLRDTLLEDERPTVATLLIAMHLGADSGALARAIARLEYAASEDETFELLFALEEATSIVTEAERLHVTPSTPSVAAEWIERTGLLGVHTFLWAFDRVPDVQIRHAEVLAMLRTKDVARRMLEHRRHVRIGGVASRFLSENPALATDTFLPLVGSDDVLAARAETYLKEMMRGGYRWLIEKKSNEYEIVKKRLLGGRATGARVTSRDLELARTLRRVPVTTDDGVKTLSPEHLAMIIAELRVSSIGAPTQRLAHFRAHIDRVVRDQIASDLFAGWLADGAPSNERHRLEVIAHLGDDRCVQELAARIRSWSAEGEYKRAMLGIDILRVVATDAALLVIHDFSRHAKSKSLKVHAVGVLEGLASDRGLTQEELEDRVIPDCGLVEPGTYTFDFGSRQFSLVLTDALQPMIMDADGKRTPDLPKPGPSDDAVRAASAIATWKAMKKQIAFVAKTQRLRLERAMVGARRWSADEVSALFARHPLMRPLVRGVVWAVFDSHGTILTSFRIADDSTFADEQDAVVTVDAAHTIGVAHPLLLDAASRVVWSASLRGCEIEQPFPQIERPVYTPTRSEGAERAIRRFEGVRHAARAVVHGLESLGYERVVDTNTNLYRAHIKAFEDVWAVVTYEEPLSMMGGSLTANETLVIDGLGFVRTRGDVDSLALDFDREADALLTLGEVDPVVFSEFVHDVTRVTAPTRPSARGKVMRTQTSQDWDLS